MHRMNFKKLIKSCNLSGALLLVVPLLFSCVDEGGIYTSNAYHTYESTEDLLFEVSAEHQDITELVPVGPTVEGRTIWAITISDNPRVNEMEPRVRLVAAIHGDENITTEMLLRLMQYITDNYSHDPAVKYIVDNTSLVIIPMLNPDGVAHRTRYNASGVDLNRNFDVAWVPAENHGATPFSEPESISLKEFSEDIVFHCSASFHSGAVVVNMPFDYARESDGVIPGEYPLVEFLAKRYSTSGRFLENEGLVDSVYVDSGTINGGDWYIIYGSLQDWSYIRTGCIDFTIEIARYNPDTLQEIEEVFDLNRESLLAFIASARIGIYGSVVDSNGYPIPGVRVSIEDGDITTITDQDGYYWKLLLPGNYVVTFSAEGFSDFSEEVEINAAPVQLPVLLVK
jgi:carboxypeptidase D